MIGEYLDYFLTFTIVIPVDNPFMFCIISIIVHSVIKGKATVWSTSPFHFCKLHLLLAKYEEFFIFFLFLSQISMKNLKKLYVLTFLVVVQVSRKSKKMRIVLSSYEATKLVKMMSSKDCHLQISFYPQLYQI